MSPKKDINGERSPLLLNTSAPSYTSELPSGATTPGGRHLLNDPSSTELTLILTALWSAVFLGALDTTIVATLLASIGSHFNRAHQSSYLGSAYLLSVCCFTPLYGRLSDIIGRKAAMLLGLAFFTGGTLFCGLAPSMETLIAARAIAGMGGGGIMTVSSITTTDLIPLKQRGLYQGLANILFGLGAGLGGPVGGFINDRFGWRWAFLIQVPVLLGSAILIAIFVNVRLPERPQTTREKLARIDYYGSLTLVLGVGGLLLGITLKGSEELPWSHPLVYGLIIGGTVFISAFVAVEGWVSKEPIMPLGMLTQRTPLAVALSNFFLSTVSFSVLYNVPLYFQAVRLDSAEVAGAHLIPNSVAIGLGSVGAGLYMRWTGKFYYLILMSALSAVIASALMSLWNESSSPLHLWLDITPAGLGMASLITATLIAIIADVDREHVAVATGITYLFRTTGQVVGVSLSGSLLQYLLAKHLRQRITGPGAAEIIQQIRHTTTIIPHLDPVTRQAAIDAYASSLRTVFIAQTVMGIVAFITCLPIEENPLPSSMEEQAEYEDRRRQRRSGTGDSTPA